MKPQPSRAAAQAAGATRGRKPQSARRLPLWRDRRAVVAVEYAVIAGVMVLIVFSVTGPFALAVGNLLNHMTDAL